MQEVWGEKIIVNRGLGLYQSMIRGVIGEEQNYDYPKIDDGISFIIPSSNAACANKAPGSATLDKEIGWLGHNGLHSCTSLLPDDRIAEPSRKMEPSLDEIKLYNGFSPIVTHPVGPISYVFPSVLRYLLPFLNAISFVAWLIFSQLRCRLAWSHSD